MRDVPVSSHPLGQLRIAQRVRTTESEGPGARYALWVQGCSIRCPGCCNPEMFAADEGEVMSIAELVHEVGVTPGIEGLTVLGGEPFEQAEGVAEVARGVRALGLSVMVFTGYVREDLERSSDPATASLLREIDLLADGPFVSLARGSVWRWLGSVNQRLHCLTDRYTLEDPRFRGNNTVDIRFERGEAGATVEVSGWAPAAMKLMKLQRKPS